MFSSHLHERSRRDFLKLSAAGVFGAVALRLAARAGRPRRRDAGNRGKAKSCILLWMDGGPSHKDTFDLKPESKGAGEFKPIKTSAPGIEISEHLPKVAKLMNHGAIVRGMTTAEGAHAARQVLHAHRLPRGAGRRRLPVHRLDRLARNSARRDFPLPNFVSIGSRSYGAGFLGPKHQPLHRHRPGPRRART